MPKLHVRSATLRDGDDVRMIEFYNSHISWLRAIGSGQQWRTELTADEQSLPRIQKWISKSEETERDCRSFDKDWARAFIGEVEVLDSSKLSPEQARLCRNGRIPVCSMVLTGRSSDYTRSIFPEQDQEDPFVFLQLLISDRRTGEFRVGAGAALLDLAKDEVRRLGLKRFVGDCFGGNERRLIK